MAETHKQLVFHTAIELANWINTNVSNPLRQEQLMLEGVKNKLSAHNVYEICVERSNKEMSLDVYGHRGITDLDLSIRAINALHANGIYLICDLHDLARNKPKEYNMILNIGKKTRQEIAEMLNLMGL
jgi:DNA-directed RNA polymerase alpha subunit